jgi:hypothetical protein
MIVLPTYTRLFKGSEFVGWMRSIFGDVVYLDPHKTHWSNHPLEHDRTEKAAMTTVPHWVRTTQHLFHSQGLRYQKGTEEHRNQKREAGNGA